ncbi:3-oxoadipate CoA-transferase subunit B [compost metagenome]
MDLAAGAEKVWVLMEHCTKDGEPRILEQCTYPLTAQNCVDRIYTDLAVIDITESGLIVRRLAEGWTLETLQAVTGAALALAPDWSAYRKPESQGE